MITETKENIEFYIANTEYTLSWLSEAAMTYAFMHN